MRGCAVATVVTVMKATLMIALVACGGSGTTTPSPSSSSPGGVPGFTEVMAGSPVPAGSGAGETPLPAPTVSGKLVFANMVRPGAYGNEDIYMVNADGTGLKPLAEAPGHDGHPALSPDGRRIVFAVTPEHDDATADAIPWIMNADGSGKRRLTDRAITGDFAAWSPDGKQIAFLHISRPALSGSIWVIGPDGDGLRRVTRPGWDAGLMPAWTPDGRICLLRNGDIVSIQPDGSGLRRLTRDGSIVGFAVSPDGKRIAVARTSQNPTRQSIAVFPVGGGGKAVTVLDPGTDFIGDDPFVALSWTSNGKALAIACAEPEGLFGGRLYVVNADGSGLSAVPGLEHAQDPAWRP